MSLHTLAQTLQKQGRGEDSVLVHMTPKEVSGLQTLALAHGGSLTINPETGLPEAGFLKNILPTVVGIGATMMGVPAWGVGLASGLTSYATNRNPQQALLSGLLSGGLAGLSGGAETAGVGALNKAGVEALASPETMAYQNYLAETFPAGSTSAFSPPTQAEFFDSPNLAKTYMPAANEQFGAEASKVMGQTDKLSRPDKIFAGVKEIAKNPIDFIKANPYASAAAGVGALGMVPPPTQVPLQHLTTQNQGQERPYRYTPYNQETRANPYYTPMYAGGGGIPYPGGMAVGGVPTSDYDARIDGHGDILKMAAGSYVPKGRADAEIYKKVADPESAKEDAELSRLIATLSRNPDKNYADGGLASLAPNEYAAGGKLLQGPGDGVSDSIPAEIKGPQPQKAALARGEFVIPARIVSEIGNGSTDAGAERLYKMMARIQAARKKTVGKDKVAVDSKAHQLLPA